MTINLNLDRTTALTILAALLTIGVFINGLWVIARGEFTMGVPKTYRRYRYTGTKAVVYGIGMVAQSVCIGMTAYLAITKKPSLIPVMYWFVGIFSSIAVAAILSVFVDGTVERLLDRS